MSKDDSLVPRPLRDYEDALAAVNGAFKDILALPPSLGMALPVIRDVLAVTVRLMKEQRDIGDASKYA